jgi:hypothetical protein
VESYPENTTFWTQSLNYAYKCALMDTLKISPIINAIHAVTVVSCVRQVLPIVPNALRKTQKHITSSQDFISVWNPVRFNTPNLKPIPVSSAPMENLVMELEVQPINAIQLVKMDARHVLDRVLISVLHAKKVQ